MIRTWHIERLLVVAAALLLAWLSPHVGAQPWIVAAARVVGFSPISIGDRIEERARLRLRWADDHGVPGNAHEVTCARHLGRALVLAFVVAGAAQACAGAWDGLAWAALCAAYRPWRALYRRLRPMETVGCRP